jgi:hypothetical protein
MFISQESPRQTHRRIKQVIADAHFYTAPGAAAQLKLVFGLEDDDTGAERY